MIQKEVIDRVLRIRFEEESATAFTLEQNGFQFIITAKHLFEKASWPNTATIDLLLEGVYKSFAVDIRYPEDDHIDIAVLHTNPYKEIAPFMGNIFSSEGMILGQDVYFLGYPYDFDTFLAGVSGSNTPLPFVKKACISGMLAPSPSVMFLDGHNNPGFSGGPVCFKKVNGSSFSIAGVISGYRYSKMAVLDENDNETDFYVKENTGIIEAMDISFAVNVAKEWIKSLL